MIYRPVCLYLQSEEVNWFAASVSRKEDPVGWLRHQKRRWRTAAAARKKRRIDTARERDRGQGSNPQPAPRGKQSILLMLTQVVGKAC